MDIGNPAPTYGVEAGEETRIEWGASQPGRPVEPMASIPGQVPYLPRYLRNRGAILVRREVRVGPWTPADTA